jgi:hypothetical protein
VKKRLKRQAAEPAWKYVSNAIPDIFFSEVESKQHYPQIKVCGVFNLAIGN